MKLRPNVVLKSIEPWLKKAKVILRRWGFVFLIVANVFVAIVVALVYSRVSGLPAMTSATPSSSPSEFANSVPVIDTEPPYNLSPEFTTTHVVSWAILDVKTGVFSGSENWNMPSFMLSTIKPWIAADYFNLHPNPSAAVLAQLSAMIVDSNDQVAYQYFTGQASWNRLVKACGLTDVVFRSWSWSLSEMSARDAVRFGGCIYSGKATSQKWTDWIVDKMRHVRGEGDFGIRELFQDRTQIATKNGWYNWEGKWYVNCLAVTSNWSISVIQQWPYAGGDLKYGVSLANPTCKIIASQVLKLST